MAQLYDAFVNRISRANSENEYRCDERPEEALFPVTEWVFLRSRTLIKPQT